MEPNQSIPTITVGELVVRFLEACDVKAAFGVISIHNMPMLDAIHRRGTLRFVPARGEAGACNMADAYARVKGGLGVCITSTGTGAGNAAGAMVEAITAGTPLLHLTGQIDSPYLDKNLGFIHEAPAQLAMLKAVGKASFRISHGEHALSVLREATQLALTAPFGPVSIEIPIDVQASFVPIPADVSPLAIMPLAPSPNAVQKMANQLKKAKRPLLWIGGGARHCQQQVQRFVAMGFGVVSSVQGRGILNDDHASNLAAFNLQKPVEAFYASCDALLVVGSRLRSNETLGYKLQLPPIYRVDVDEAANQRAYPNKAFIQGDAALTLDALADALSGAMQIDTQLRSDLSAAKEEAEAQVDGGLGAYAELKDTLNKLVTDKLSGDCFWVRDITLSNTMWGNRSLYLRSPRAGVHALGGGIGQGLAMGIGAAICSDEHALEKKTIVLMGDGGFMLNLGELACAKQENCNVIFILMNDGGYGVIKNIQDAVYGGRHCYVDLHTPDFSLLCKSMGVRHLSLKKPEDTEQVLGEAILLHEPVVVEVDMHSWGPFVAKFAGPPQKV